jgi:hypothetical protein
MVDYQSGHSQHAGEISSQNALSDSSRSRTGPSDAQKRKMMEIPERHEYRRQRLHLASCQPLNAGISAQAHYKSCATANPAGSCISILSPARTYAFALDGKRVNCHGVHSNAHEAFEPSQSRGGLGQEPGGGGGKRTGSRRSNMRTTTSGDHRYSRGTGDITQDFTFCARGRWQSPLRALHRSIPNGRKRCLFSFRLMKEMRRHKRTTRL